MQLRDKLLSSVKSHAQGHIDKHLANIEVYLANPAGIGEHSDIMEAIEKELEEVSVIAIAEDENGVIYFGGTNGIITYENNKWNKMKLPSVL